MTTQIPKPIATSTQAADQAAVSRTPITCALRWANRSMASIAAMAPQTINQAERGTSSSDAAAGKSP
ncbi:hypothetical protein [Cryobacterium algoritolerans]|uniref:hypothetical protein n=1 Tax=Cryobacterium algoritolerans TaxID=1259184 RepID=UPI003B976D1A